MFVREVGRRGWEGGRVGEKGQRSVAKGVASKETRGISSSNDHLPWLIRELQQTQRSPGDRAKLHWMMMIFLSIEQRNKRCVGFGKSRNTIF